MSASESMKHVATLGNSIIGVSVLAMPFCFKQCGILLGTLMLIGSALLTRFNCHLLLKGALLARRKTYELFAFYCFGYYGKLIVETSIIGFLVGILISFFVVIGDLGPQIISKSFEIEDLPPLRTLVLTALGIGVALPLGLLKNITSLGGISAISILFYIALAIKVFFEAVPVLATGVWLDKVTYWQPNGILQSLPIFALALSCQTQIFEISNALPDSSLGKMNKMIKMAVYLCTAIYICVGFFGYVAFCNEDFSGNILVMMPSSVMTQLIKLGFVLSVVLSFPLVIFPCRASLYSLFNRKVHTAFDTGVSAFIPESRFRLITVGLVVTTLIMGILCPNIELVLGIVGSTIGTIICTIFPALMFIRITNRNTFERSGAQIVFCVGVFLLVASTFVTLNNSTLQGPVPTYRAPKIDLHPDLLMKYDKPPAQSKVPVQSKIQITEKIEEKPALIEPQVVKDNILEKIQTVAEVNHDEQRRQEPPNPQESIQEPVQDSRQEKVKEPEVSIPQEVRKEKPFVAQEQIKTVRKEEEVEKKAKIEELEQVQEKRQEPPIPQEPESNNKDIQKEKISIPTVQPSIEKQTEKSKIPVDKQNEAAVQQAGEILKQLAEQQIESKKLLQEQKQVLEELKKHKDLHQPEAKTEKSQNKKNGTEERKNIVVELIEKRKERILENGNGNGKAEKNLTPQIVLEAATQKSVVTQTNIKFEEKKVEDVELEKKAVEDVSPVRPVKVVSRNESNVIPTVAKVNIPLVTKVDVKSKPEI